MLQSGSHAMRPESDRVRYDLRVPTLPRAARYAALLLAVGGQAISVPHPAASRAPTEGMNDAVVRTRPGLLPGANLLFNGWGVTPAGDQVPTRSDMVLRMVIAPDHKHLLAVGGAFQELGVTVLDIARRRPTQFLPLARCWNGLAFSRDGKRVFVTGADSGVLHVLEYSNGTLTAAAPVTLAARDPKVFLAAVAVHPRTGRLYVVNEGNHEVLVLHQDSLKVEARIPTGQHPHSAVFGGDARYLFVTNWGSRSVSVIDTDTNERLRDITVGLRPNDLALAPDGRLFVACAGDNTIHVIATNPLEPAPASASPVRRLWEGAREVISTSLYPQSPEGSTPDAVVVSPDGRTLFVANADNNDVMVVNISGALTPDAHARGDSISIVDGFIPVGWYPTALAVSPDGDTLFVANGKGLTSRASVPARAPRPMLVPGEPPFDASGKIFDGSISVIRRPDAAQMAAYTEQVRRNSPYTPESLVRAPIASASVVPEKVGAPSPIKYVLYIIKENRTYDQVLGDLKDASGKRIGNGAAELTIFGEQVTPNQHQLAREYVLLDNLYSNSEVSVDGHSWCDAAMATDYNQRTWIARYSGHGDVPGNEEMETPAAGYLWDLCRRHGVSYRNYGEGAQRVPSVNRGRWGQYETVRDTELVDYWLQDLAQAERSGVLPRFTVMSLGENHTQGTRAGQYTPSACVGSNDLALAKIVAAASRSRFWPEMAIFVVEDDTQNGPDHIDAHRTVGFVISPYAKRGMVDSTFYTTASMIRTMELILGLPPLTQYDAAATPMFNAFGRRAILTPYAIRTPGVDLNARNPATAPGADESARMDFSEYDRAPEDALNRILWAAAKPGVPYPAPVHRAIFTNRVVVRQDVPR
jgi:YVTN family beta-propeller protein